MGQQSQVSVVLCLNMWCLYQPCLATLGLSSPTMCCVAGASVMLNSQNALPSGLRLGSTKRRLQPPGMRGSHLVLVAGDSFPPAAMHSKVLDAPDIISNGHSYLCPRRAGHQLVPYCLFKPYAEYLVSSKNPACCLPKISLSS